jgi:hypothetical protein
MLSCELARKNPELKDLLAAYEAQFLQMLSL